jgi:hypothetical protein
MSLNLRHGKTRDTYRLKSGMRFRWCLSQLNIGDILQISWSSFVALPECDSASVF